MLNSLTSRFHATSRATQQPELALHGQHKAPRLNQIADQQPQVSFARSLMKAGSRVVGAFRARQRDLGKHEQRDWHAPLMRIARDGSGLQMVNSTAAHAITEKLNAEGSYSNVRALLAREIGTGVKGYLLRDQDNHYHQVQQNPALISTLKSSTSLTEPPEPAGKGHQAESSGIYTDAHNRQYTLHNRSLFTFDSDAQRWTPVESEHRDVSRLALDHTGELIRYRNKGELRDYSSTATHEAQLLRDGRVRLSEMSDSRASLGERSKGQPTFETRLYNAKGEPLVVSRVGLLPPSNGQATLFAIDQDNQLHHVRLPPQLSPQAKLRLRPVQIDYQSAVGAEAAQHASLEGFIADRGRLKAVFRDGMGLRHSAALHRPQSTASGTALAKLEPGWRLSEQMHLVNRSGLPERIGPGDTQVRLHGGAALGLNADKELCGWNESSQQWDRLDVGGVSQLLRGLDDKAYVIQDGKARALQASFAQPQLQVGDKEAVALGRSTVVEAGNTLADEHASHCAVLDAKHFVLLSNDAPARLKAHLDGISVNIPAPHNREGEALPVSSLALDQAKHLYASAGDNLYRLPHDQWTQSQQGATARWKPVGLKPSVASAPSPASTGGVHQPVADSPLQNAAVDGLKDMIREVAQQTLDTLPDGLSWSGAHVQIGPVAMGPNKRPVFQATLRPSSAGSETAVPRPTSLALELFHGPSGNLMLRPAKSQAAPSANRHWEVLQARNHTTRKVGNANGAATTTLLGSTTDNVRVAGDRNLFTRATEAVRRVADSYGRHFHPIDTPKASVDGLRQAIAAGDGIKQKLQAAGYHATTSNERKRSGLNPVYRESQRLYQSFASPTAMAPRAEVPAVTSPAMARVDDLETRLSRLNAPSQALLQKRLAALGDEVATSSYNAIVRLGQIHGLLDASGKALKPPSANTTLASTTNVLASALNHSGLSAHSKARDKFNELIRLGLELPDRRFDTGPEKTGRNNSPSALLEDRILLDVQLLRQIGDLVERLPSAMSDAAQGNSSPLDQLQGLHMAYERSDIKLFSDNGIVSHSQLEKLHEARQTLARELTGKHALNYNTTRSFGADLHALGEHLGNLQVKDAANLLRSKGGAFTVPALILPLTPDGGGLYINFGGGRDHAIALESEGDAEGTLLGLKNTAGNNGFINVGYYHAPTAVVSQFRSSNPSNGGQLYSAEINGKLTWSKGVQGWVSANNASMVNIMENLLDPSASLADLYRLGQPKYGSVETVASRQQSIGINLSVDLSRLNAGGNLRQDGDRTWDAFLRMTAGASAEATLMSNATHRVQVHEGLEQEALVTVKARDVLPTAKVGAYARAGLATFGTVMPDQSANSQGVNNNIIIGQTSLLDTLSASFTIDRAKNHEFALVFAPGKAVTTPQLHDLEKLLGEVLQAPDILQALSERRRLLQALERCLSTADLPTPLEARPFGGFVSQTPPIRQRASETGLGELLGLLPQLRAGVPQYKAQIDALQREITRLPIPATETQQKSLFAHARELAMKIKQTSPEPSDSVLLSKAGDALRAGVPLAAPNKHLGALQRLITPLDKLPHDNLELHKLAYGMQQLSSNQASLERGTRLLSAAQCKTTSSGLQLKKGGLLGTSAAWRNSTSPRNAEALAAFINKHPLLKEMARRAEHEGPTSMELTIELTPDAMARLEAELNARPPELQKRFENILRDTENYRISRLTLLRSATQSNAVATPNLLLSARSSVSFSDAVVLASMSITYHPRRQHEPISVTPGGLLAQPRVSKALHDDLAHQNVTLTGSLPQSPPTDADDSATLSLPAEDVTIHTTNDTHPISDINARGVPHGTGVL